MMTLKNQAKSSILVIVGQTATGKSALAISLAKKFNGEVVSADSRQVYKGMNIGTGKVTRQEMKGVKHHMLDVADPKPSGAKAYNVAKFQRDTHAVIADILKRGKLPIICGGTGFYIQAIVDNTSLPDVTADATLRKKLGKLSAEKLLPMLKKLDPKRAKRIDPKNKVRVIRAIEIAQALGKVPAVVSSPLYNSVQIGIRLPDNELRAGIHKRLMNRMKQGMLREAKKLHATGLSWKRMEQLGLEYRYVAFFLQGKIKRDEMLTQLESEIWHYARRQKTWFARDKRIKWFSPKDTNKMSTFVKRNLK